MQLIRIYRDSMDYEKIDRINNEAFPENEHIDTEDFFEQLEGLDKRVLGVYDDEGVLVGFFMLIFTDRCAYICYFAMDPSRRGGGLGSHALALLHEYCGERMIVVDFEALDETAENNALRKRRRAFYLRNGFYETGYFQFYMECEFEIFSSREVYDRPAYEELLDTIKRHFGEYLTPHYRKD